MRRGNHGNWYVLMALGLTVLVGCRTAHPPQSNGLTTSPDSTSANQLTNAQVADLHVAIGRTLEKRGELEAAAASYQKAMEKDATRADTSGRLAVVYDRQGRFRESEEMYRAAIKQQPHDPELVCNYGYSLYLQGRLEEGARVFNRALTLRPDHARAHNNLGLVLAQQGHSDEALQQFAMAGCSKADAHCNLAYAMTLDQSFDKAIKHYQLALNADPNSEVANQGLHAARTLSAKATGATPVDGVGVTANRETRQ